MAGEALSDPNYEARARIAASPERTAERLSGLDRDSFNFDGYSDKEIVMAMKGSSFGEEDYARLTGRTGRDKPEREPNPEPKPEAPVEETPSPEPTPPPAETPNPTAGTGDQRIGVPGYKYHDFGGLSQNVNQDNDITSSVTGDNNTVDNNQDNSINAYAGDAQRFTNDYIKRFTQKFA